MPDFEPTNGACTIEIDGQLRGVFWIGHWKFLYRLTSIRLKPPKGCPARHSLYPCKLEKLLLNRANGHMKIKNFKSESALCSFKAFII